MRNTKVRVYPCSCVVMAEPGYAELLEACPVGREHDRETNLVSRGAYLVENYPGHFVPEQRSIILQNEKTARGLMALHLGDDYREIDLKEVC